MSVHLDQLRKQYFGPDGSVVPVIEIDDFRLNSGEQAALIGTSGSGKTTLLHLMAGILTPDSGRILFSDEANAVPARAAENSVIDCQSTQSDALGTVDLAAMSEARRDAFRGRYIGYIFQTHHLLSSFTAMENVLLGMSFTGRRRDPEWAKYLLNEVGLSDRLHYKPEKLSVGQQQRVAVARALANRPTLVLADEPTGALDERNAQQVLDLIRKLCGEVAASLLLVSHDSRIAGQLPRVVSLKEIQNLGIGDRGSGVGKKPVLDSGISDPQSPTFGP